MTSLCLLAGSGTAAEFRAAFTATDDATDLLIPALTTPTAAERAKIAMFLLDQGADVNGDSEGRSPMHVLFAQQKHSFKQEAPLVQRMLEAGADINQRERRGDLPILQLVGNSSVRDDLAALLYEVLLDWPGLDLSLPVSPSRPDGRTARDEIMSGAWVRKRLRAMIEAKGL